MSVMVGKPKSSAIIDAIKVLADMHRDELGFHSRQSLRESLQRGEILVGTESTRLVGFARFHTRRDRTTTIYEIVTAPEYRRRGIARRLVTAIVEEVRQYGARLLRLLCPVDLPANAFYEAVGFTRSSSRSQPGKLRPLFEWQMPILPPRAITFVASLTNAASDLKHLIRLWEAEGPAERPFEQCIITPLFTEPRSLPHVRYMHDRWGVKVMFDSGGFFVQQRKVTYDQLFTRLLSYYCANDWAEIYVLPDYVPTSRNTLEEVEERVHVTAAEGVKFFRRMPAALRPHALGVLQGYNARHLKFCLDAYQDNSIPHLGFGSFDTGGVNAEINLFTAKATQRLVALRKLLVEPYSHGEVDSLPRLHLFGVSSPALLEQFPRFLASSFDSSGWLRTAGYGNIYLPFQSRRNVTHGASALSCGPGFTAATFYTECALTGHSCPFCHDFSRIQSDRYARMWHNALVFGEMTARLNAWTSPRPAQTAGIGR